MKDKIYYKIITFGCQMNYSDSERIAQILQTMGLFKAENEAQANVLIINACSIRQTGIDRIYGRFKQWKNKKNYLTILTGCVLKSDLKIFNKYFNAVINIENITLIKQEINNHFNLQDNHYSFDNLDSYFHIKPILQNKSTGYVPIMTGCNNFCSYCVVPYTRGREQSRNIKEVLAEVKCLVEQGAKEIVLLGQNVNSYQPQDLNNLSSQNLYKTFFAALLWEINQIENINRINFTSSHPKDVTDELIDALCLPKMVNYFHLPIQSGDNDLLKKMNRHYTVDDYKKIIQKVRQKRPDICLGTDVIVGFPTETKQQFENTASLVREIGFDIIYHAMYSPRRGTKAFEMTDNVSHEEKRKRWLVIDQIVQDYNLQKNKNFENKTVEVLVNRFERGHWFGFSRELKTVKFPGNKNQNLKGQIVKVRIDMGMEWALLGKMIEKNK